MPISYPKFRNPRDNRLAKEHELLDDFCSQSKLVDYEAVPRKGGLPPERYIITYYVRSIIGIDEDKSPIYGDEHIAEIVIPPEYPLGGQPSCYMKTPVWHPNIKFDGRFAGKICVNKKALGHWHTMNMMAERIGEILQYKNYYAINEPPYPEDANVATWVRQYAEPNGIVNKERGIFVDDRPLLETSQEWLESRKKKIQITIIGRRKNESLSDEQAKSIMQNSQLMRRAVKLIKRSQMKPKTILSLKGSAHVSHPCIYTVNRNPIAYVRWSDLEID